MSTAQKISGKEGTTTPVEFEVILDAYANREENEYVAQSCGHICQVPSVIRDSCCQCSNAKIMCQQCRSNENHNHTFQKKRFYCHKHDIPVGCDEYGQCTLCNYKYKALLKMPSLVKFQKNKWVRWMKPNKRKIARRILKAWRKMFPTCICGVERIKENGYENIEKLWEKFRILKVAVKFTEVLHSESCLNKHAKWLWELDQYKEKKKSTLPVLQICESIEEMVKDISVGSPCEENEEACEQEENDSTSKTDGKSQQAAEEVKFDLSDSNWPALAPEMKKDNAHCENIENITPTTLTEWIMLHNSDDESDDGDDNDDDDSNFSFVDHSDAFSDSTSWGLVPENGGAPVSEHSAPVVSFARAVSNGLSAENPLGKPGQLFLQKLKQNRNSMKENLRTRIIGKNWPPIDGSWPRGNYSEADWYKECTWHKYSHTKNSRQGWRKSSGTGKKSSRAYRQMLQRFKCK